ncbi:MAG: hypothetical protein WCJ35_10460 [Planctomycetota bacterium]
MAKHAESSMLLEELSRMGSNGRAEGEDKDRFPKTFHPIAEHVRAFDPNVVLVIGPRGAGKSELFRAAVELKLLPAIERCLPEIRPFLARTQQVQWFAGYPIGSEFPDARGFAAFLRECENDREAAFKLWFAYLVRVLQGELRCRDSETLRSLLNPDGGEPNKVYEAFCSFSGNEPLLALDRLDKDLQQNDRYLFVGYDELDTLGANDWQTMSAAIRGLIAFWSAYTRRWQRIRAKVFLRTDLFHRYATEGGGDLAKLAANRVELVWSDRNLYAMLLKRIVNSSDELYRHIKEAPRNKIEFFDDPALGHVPRITDSEDIRPIIDRLIGQYMGSNVKKGLTYRWLINHVRDGFGRALPRPLVRLVEVAADIQIGSSRAAGWPRLILPTSMGRALDKVSVEQVQHSLDEWPWLDGLKKRIKSAIVPCHRKRLEHLLTEDWDGRWGDTAAAIRPPVENARDLIDYLVEVGILRARSDGRLDAADLFLAGLGLKRKGGVRKK